VGDRSHASAGVMPTSRPCTLYWRRGAELDERGEPDPHRSRCAECRAAKVERDAIVALLASLPDIAPSGRRWQSRVWMRIARGDHLKLANVEPS
jgi:hypothetical protein